ncbi:uncharacterized conserved protein [Hydrogenimonas sp.]|nr:uncharacterized conserved protein [Hydrogenimonas sp.]
MKAFTLFTDRHGGVSPAPYSSFNLAYHTGDDPALVDRNRKILTDITTLPLIFMEQVHGDAIAVADENSPSTIPGCDAVVTTRRDIALAVMTADCIPILLYDETAGTAAAVHAGRSGTFLNIASKCVGVMVERFGCRPENIAARFGPSIRSCCYEISAEMAETVEKRFGKEYMNGRYLDLQKLNRNLLLDAGLEEGNIEISEICTCCSADHFSYRREGVTGRCAGVIWMREE